VRINQLAINIIASMFRLLAIPASGLPEQFEVLISENYFGKKYKAFQLRI